MSNLNAFLTVGSLDVMGSQPAIPLHFLASPSLQSIVQLALTISMFKSRSRKDKKNARRRPATSDDEEVEDAVTETLQTVKKRRILLTTLQYKRGTDASQLLSTTKHHEPTAEGEDESLPANTKRSEQQVWKEHHAAAMEDYIRQNMSEHKQEEDAKDESSSKPKSHKDELYQEIAKTAAELSGKSNALTSATTGSIPNTTEVVRSGAATAMAEVILPSASSRKPLRRNYEPEPVTAAAVEEGERLGFAAARGLVNPQAKTSRQPSADDRAYANFVHRQRR